MFTKKESKQTKGNELTANSKKKNLSSNLSYFPIKIFPLLCYEISLFSIFCKRLICKFNQIVLHYTYVHAISWLRYSLLGV